MLKSLIAASLACATVLSSAAYAGPIPQNYYYRTSQNVKINYALPVSCDTNIGAAAAAVNGLGTKFQLTGARNYYTSTYYDANQDPGFVNVQDASSMSSLMTTQRSYIVGSTTPYETTDSSVYINADRLYYDSGDTVKSTDFVCGDAVTASNIGTRIDFQSALTHEFGHVMGMDHRTDGTTGPCLMATYLNAGQIKRTFCTDEKGLMLGFYGAR